VNSAPAISVEEGERGVWWVVVKKTLKRVFLHVIPIWISIVKFLRPVPVIEAYQAI
jgi:hypothetical protein